MKLDNYTQISTKKGDKGTSSNYSNERFDKDDILFDTVGTIDELSSLLGVIYHYVKYKEEIKVIQRMLQDINSMVATTDEKRYEALNKVTKSDISYLEALEQTLLKHVSIERLFVLPGSETSKENAYLHLGRTVARRAERTLVKYVKYTKRNDLDLSLAYLNRLSDLLFIMANE